VPPVHSQVVQPVAVDIGHRARRDGTVIRRWSTARTHTVARSKRHSPAVPYPASIVVISPSQSRMTHCSVKLLRLACSTGAANEVPRLNAYHQFHCRHLPSGPRNRTGQSVRRH
jgi:hypothetical protein